MKEAKRAGEAEDNQGTKVIAFRGTAEDRAMLKRAKAATGIRGNGEVIRFALKALVEMSERAVHP